MKRPSKRATSEDREKAELRARLEEAEEVLRSIREGEVDALLISDKVYTLQGADAPYRFLIETMNEGAVLMPQDSTLIHYCNHRMAGLLRLTPDRVMGHPFEQFVVPSDRPAFAALLARARQAPASGELLLGVENAPPLPVKLSIARVDKPDHPDMGVVVTDLSELKTAENALRENEVRTAYVLEAGGIGTWVVDIANRTAIRSLTHARIFGYPDLTVEWSYQRLLEQIIPEDRRRVEEAVQRGIETGSGWKLEFQIRRLDGEVRWLEAQGVNYGHTATTSGQMVGIVKDITERKQAERDLLAAKVTAESAVRAKSDFLAMMTHELRTPLNGLLGFAEILSDTKLNDEQRQYAQIISSSGAHLLAVINDILDFSSVEHGRLEIAEAPFSIDEVLESSMLIIRESASKKGLDLRSERGPGVPEQMTSDARRVRQILINLLGNAVKFTARGSIVLRVAASTLNNQPAVNFSVADTGLGISAEGLGRLFQPFTQANSMIGSSFGGTGLGLSISQRLAQAMNGTLTVTSTLGQGSVFTLSLPLQGSFPAPSLPSPAVPVRSETGASAGKLILVVEDDRTGGVIALKMLHDLGYHVELATNGAEAVEAFSPGKYAAILMDVAMPLMDGLAATRRIRQAEEASGHRVPIIAFTAQAMSGDYGPCLAAGMDDFLAKPFKKAQLAAKLALVLQRP